MYRSVVCRIEVLCSRAVGILYPMVGQHEGLWLQSSGSLCCTALSDLLVELLPLFDCWLFHVCMIKITAQLSCRVSFFYH